MSYLHSIPPSHQYLQKIEPQKEKQMKDLSQIFVIQILTPIC